MDLIDDFLNFAYTQNIFKDLIEITSINVLRHTSIINQFKFILTLTNNHNYLFLVDMNDR